MERRGLSPAARAGGLAMTLLFNTDRIAGKTALISGGSSGIGLGIARLLASLGSNVAIFGRDPKKASDAAAELSLATSTRVIGLSADVRDPEALDSVIQQTVLAFGSLDIVVAGAAGNFPAPAIDISPKGFKTVVDIDLLGTYNLFRLAFDHLTKPGSSLIAITAGQAMNPTPLQAHVCAAKAGINMLVQCLALEWGPAGVRVNGISPGPIAGTEGLGRLAPGPNALQALIDRVPLRRLGEREEIAELVVFLAASATYVTGAIYPCDGGSGVGSSDIDCLVSRRGV